MLLKKLDSRFRGNDIRQQKNVHITNCDTASRGGESGIMPDYVFAVAGKQTLGNSMIYFGYMASDTIRNTHQGLMFYPTDEPALANEVSQRAMQLDNENLSTWNRTLSGLRLRTE